MTDAESYGLIGRILIALRKRAAVVWLATLLLVVLGIDAARQMPSAVYPEVEFPRIVVVAKSGGATPDVFLSSVTRPLELALTTVLGVQRIRSKTIRGGTEISLQFAPETDMWRALTLVESRVNQTRSALPQDTEIEVERITTGSFPILTFNLTGPVDPRQLREIAAFIVRPALGNVPGVGRIEVLGGDVRELEIILNPELTSALHLTPGTVADKIRTANSLNAVGRLDRDRQLVTVLADAQPKTSEEIAQLPILTTPSGSVLPLSAVAEVYEGAEDRLVRIAGPQGTAVSISVARLPGASTPTVVAGLLEAAKSLRPSLPPGVVLEPVYDQARLVNESMASVRDAIVLGILLCAGVIALFLGSFRAGLLAATSVPITLAMSFIVMRVAGQTLNLMSLGGMAVAIGLVVDDAIVMVEAIARRRDEGADDVDASIQGTLDLAPAVIGTTLTTVVVFVPLAFLKGLVGDFFRALAFTVTTAVSISLLVAIVLVPLAARLGLSSVRRRETQPTAERYRRVLLRIGRYPWLSTIFLVLVIAVGASLVPRVGRGFLPAMDEGAFVLDYFLPAGTGLKTTDQFARAIEDELKKTPEVRTFTRRTGAELGPATATQLHRGDIMVRLVDASARKRSSEEVISDLRARIEKAYPEVRIEFVQVLQDVLNDLAGNPRPIEVKLFGPDYKVLGEIGERLGAKLKDVPGLVDLYDGHERESPSVVLSMRREEIARLGTTPDEISAQLAAALRGEMVGTIRRDDRLIALRARYPDPIRFDPLRLMNLPLALAGKQTTFGAVVDSQESVAPSQLLHEALQPMVTVTADHEHRDLGSIGRDVDAAVAGLSLPPGYRAVIGGQLAGERESTRSILAVGGIALLLVITVLAGQFRKLRTAFLVLVTVPVALVGALVSLLATNVPLNASSLMGAVLLVGLVVKNGVLLLEEAERRVEQGEPSIEAVAGAGERRIRPVLMTTMATLAGLLPLAAGIGAGAELQKPLAIAVIGGLVTSTIATLLLLPPLAALALRVRKAG